MASLRTWFKDVRESKRINSAIREMAVRYVRESADNVDLSEALSRLQLEIENLGWNRLTSPNLNQEFSRANLQIIQDTALAMAIKNPITARSIHVQADYVFGQGVSFTAKDPRIQEVVDDFTNDPSNQRVLTSHPAFLRRERELQIFGNLFIALYTGRTGKVRVRFIDPAEVNDIIRNPEDYEDPWFIKRTTINESGQMTQNKCVYHPVVGVTDDGNHFLPEGEDGQIIWDVPVYHVAVNYFGKMRLGISEVYAQLDWATAYKKFLENWATIMQAFARQAMKIVGLPGKKAVGAAKSKLQTTTSLTQPFEHNPSAASGSTFLGAGNVNIEPVKTAGATTPAEEGKPILNMAAASVGLPNTFFGDASIGNYATAKTLDRPTELKMLSRQRLWQIILGDIIRFVIDRAVKAKGGKLNGVFQMTQVVPEFAGDPEWVIDYGDTDPSVDVEFPEILERNVTDRVRAVVNACTLFGKPLVDIIPDKRLVARLLLQALKVENVDALIPQFVTLWGGEYKIEPPPEPAPGGGAEDPSQGGATGNNG